jgi:hypothetical protein
VNSGEIARRRMHSQHLWGTPFETLEDAVRWLGALQSQEYAVAKWSVAQRTTGVSDAAMDRAVADGTVVRTHVLRPTWHFVLPEDLRWMLDLTAPRVHALNAHYYRKLGLDHELFVRSSTVLAEALRGGGRYTRKALAAVLAEGGISADGVQLGYLLMRAELDAVICSGGLNGKQHTYALFDERVPEARPVDRDEALAELTRRYFTARGPATVRDYLWWSSLTAADGRRGIDMVREQLEQQVVDGRSYWFAESSPMVNNRPGRIDLVQGYDECVVSYSESKDVLLGRLVSREMLRDRPVFIHAVLLDGRLIGHWRPVPKGKRVVIETSLYRPLDHAGRRALDAAIARYVGFKEGPPGE